MPIAEGVYVQDVDITAHTQEVLEERSEHVPRVEIEEGSDKVETESRCQGDDDDTRSRRAEEGFHKIARTIGIEPLCFLVTESMNDEVERVDSDVELDETEDAKGDNVGPARSLWSVTQRENEL